MQLGYLEPHVHAQGCVKVGQWLVEQECGRFTDDGPADGNPLALSAGQLAAGDDQGSRSG